MALALPGLTMTSTMDLVDLERAMGRYVRDLGLTWPRIIEQTFRLLMQETLRFTPPRSLAQGRRAVQRDINRAITPFDPIRIVHFTKLRDAVIARDMPLVQAILRNLRVGNWRNVQVVAFDPNYHTSVRDRRGRVQRSRQIVTLDLSQHRRYVRSVQGHVGYTKSGWAPSAIHAGINVPQWVRRHATPPGQFIDNLHIPDRPSVTAIHDGKTTDSAIDRLRLQAMIRRRAGQMHRDVDQVLRGRPSRYFTP